MSERRWRLDDGKYEAVFNEATGEFYALRNGKPWRDLTGDKFVLALAQAIDAARLDALSKAAEVARTWGNAPPREGGRRDQLARKILSLAEKT